MAQWDPIHSIADRVEPRVVRALGGAFDRMRERLPVEGLEHALARGDLRVANDIVHHVDFADALEPAAQILFDAVIRGGKREAEGMRRA